MKTFTGKVIGFRDALDDAEAPGFYVSVADVDQVDSLQLESFESAFAEHVATADPVNDGTDNETKQEIYIFSLIHLSLILIYRN